MLSALAAGYAYRPEVRALLDMLFRATITIVGFRLLIHRSDLLAVLPEDGSDRYLAFRRAAGTWIRVVLGASVLLLALYTFGFRHAAATILLRSWAIVGLVLLGALAQRWLDRHEHAGPARRQSIVRAIRRKLDTFARFVLRVVFLVAVFAILGVWEPIVEALRTPLFTVGESAVTLWNVLRAAAFVASAIIVSRLVRVVLEEVVFPRQKLDVGAGYAISTAVHYVILFLGVGVGLVALGLDLSAMAVFAGALGVGIGLGLQDITRNLVSGFILLFGGSVKKGDLVTVNDKWFGRISSIGTRSVTVRTNDWSELVIPSSELVNSTIVNWTRSSPHIRLHVAVGVSYRSSVPEVKEALLEAARRFEMASPLHEPDVWLTGFGDSSVDFELLVWIDAAQHARDAAMGKVLYHVWDALAERGIEIPFPQRDIHVRSVFEQQTLPPLPKG